MKTTDKTIVMKFISFKIKDHLVSSNFSLLICLGLCLLFFTNVDGQGIPGFRYQAVAKDANGDVIKNQDISLRFTIINANATPLFSEIHDVQVGGDGIFALTIGEGVLVSGNINAIDWSKGGHGLEIELDANDNGIFTTMGTSIFTAVPYAAHAMTVDNSDDDDADPSNEIQSLSFDPATNQLSLSGSNSVVIPSGGADADADPSNEIQTISKSGSTVTLSQNGGSFEDETEDADANPSNEIQSLTRNGSEISLSLNGGSFTDQVNDDDANPSNELQTLSKSGSIISLSQDGGSFEDETEDADANPSNEIQSLSRNGSEISLSLNGGSFTDQVDDDDADPSNELQTLSKSGSIISLSQDGGSFEDETEDDDADPNNEIQNLSFDPSSNALSISGGNSVTIATTTTDADADPTNELQSLSRNGSIISLSQNGGSFEDETEDGDADPGNEIQVLSKSGSTVSLNHGGGSFEDDVIDDDADPNNEIQVLSKSGSVVSLSNNGGSFEDSVEDADADSTNELQNLSINLENLPVVEFNIDNGNGVTFSIQDDDSDPTNEVQTVSKNGNVVSLSLEGGSFLDEVKDADSDTLNEIQLLSIHADSLSISHGNRVSLTSYKSPWSKVDQGILYDTGIVFASKLDLDSCLVISNDSSSISTVISDDGMYVQDSMYKQSAYYGPMWAYYTASSYFNSLIRTVVGPGGIVNEMQDSSGNYTGFAKFNFEGAEQTNYNFQLDQNFYSNLTSLGLNINVFDSTETAPRKSVSLQADSLNFNGPSIGLLLPTSSRLTSGQIRFTDGVATSSLSQFGLSIEDNLFGLNTGTNFLAIRDFSDPMLHFDRVYLSPGKFEMTNGSKFLNVRIGSGFSDTNGEIDLFSGSLQGERIVSLGAPIASGDGAVDVFSGGQQRASFNAFGGSGFLGLQGPNGFSNLNIGPDPINDNRGNLKIFDEIGNTQVESGVGTNGSGFVEVIGQNGSTNVHIGTNSNNQNIGAVSVRDDVGIEKALFGVGTSNEGFLATNGVTQGIFNILAGANFLNQDMGGLYVFDNNNGVAASILADDISGFGTIRTNGSIATRDNFNQDLAGFSFNQIFSNNGWLSINELDVNAVPQTRVSAHAFGSNGTIELFDGQNDLNVVMEAGNGSHRGKLEIYNQNDFPAAQMFVDNAGLGNILLNGVVVTAISHPQKSNKEVAYTGVIGSEAMSIVRGTSRLTAGEVEVILPDHFRAINNLSTMTVVLTPLSADTYGLAVIEKSDKGFVVKELAKGTGNFKFDWEVKCTLKGRENLKVVREKNIASKPSERKANHSTDITLDK